MFVEFSWWSNKFSIKGDGVYNMVVEVPRWSNAKIEIDLKSGLNPLKQDVKKGKLRQAKILGVFFLKKRSNLCMYCVKSVSQLQSKAIINMRLIILCLVSILRTVRLNNRFRLKLAHGFQTDRHRTTLYYRYIFDGRYICNLCFKSFSEMHFMQLFLCPGMLPTSSPTMDISGTMELSPR